MPQDNQPERFILMHTDLRCSNILVDDQLRIVGVIDSEWAGTVPVEFFAPPFWILDSEQILAEFHSVLQSLEKKAPVALLQEEWISCEDITTQIARIFRHPLQLVDVFYNYIYPRVFDEPEDEALRKFSASEQHQEEIRQRLQSSNRYTEYLKENGLYEIDERTQKANEWIAKAEAYLKYLKDEEKQ